MNFEFTEEQVMFRKMAREFAEREMIPTLKDCEREKRINHDVIKKLASLGLIGMHLPDKYGGLGLDLVTACVVWEQLELGELDADADLHSLGRARGHNPFQGGQ